MTLLEWKLLQFLAKPCEDDPEKLENCFTLSPDGRVYFTGWGEFNAETKKAARRIAERGWSSADKYGHHRLNKEGLQAARAPRPVWSAPAPAPLSLSDRNNLRALIWHRDRGREWVTPLDCGGENGSHHSASLAKLVRHGFAECLKSGKILTAETIIPEPRLTKRAKGSRRFRATDKGVEEMEKMTKEAKKS